MIETVVNTQCGPGHPAAYGVAEKTNTAFQV